MAYSNNSRYIPSNPESILNYFDHIASDDSDSDFDGYIEESASKDEESPTDHSNSLPNQISNSSFTSFHRAPPKSVTPSNFITHIIIYT